MAEAEYGRASGYIDGVSDLGIPLGVDENGTPLLKDVADRKVMGPNGTRYL